MNQSYNQQIDPAGPVQAADGDSARQKDVGKQYNNRCQELQKGSVEPLHVFDIFVEQDNRGIKDSRTQSVQDADQVLAAADGANTCDHHKSKGRHDEAYDLFACHLFPKENGADNRDDHRGEIVTQSCCRHGSKFISFKQ